jgi:hypothetical protein
MVCRALRDCRGFRCVFRFRGKQPGATSQAGRRQDAGALAKERPMLRKMREAWVTHTMWLRSRRRLHTKRKRRKSNAGVRGVRRAITNWKQERTRIPGEGAARLTFWVWRARESVAVNVTVREPGARNFRLNGNLERRKSLRVTPDPLWIIRLPEGNQGVVLDVSAEGLGFLAVAAVKERATFRFEMGTRGGGAAEASGRLVWNHPGGKRGGLLFTHLPPEARELLRGLVGSVRSSSEQASEAALLAALEAENGEAKVRPREKITRESTLESERESAERDDRAEPSGSRRGLLAANMLALALAGLVVLGAWYSMGYSLHGREARAVLARAEAPMKAVAAKELARVPNWESEVKIVAQQLKEKQVAVIARIIRRPAPAAPVVPAAAPVATSPIAPIPSATPKVENAAETAAPPPAPVNGTESAAGAGLLPTAAEKMGTHEQAAGVPQELGEVAASESAKSERVPATAAATRERKKPRAEADASKPDASVASLWQAVAKGDPAAAVELAGHYLSGEGVSKNCNQALVLLSAAENKKYAPAEEKLKTAGQYGCEAPQRAEVPQAPDVPASGAAEPVP